MHIIFKADCATIDKDSMVGGKIKANCPHVRLGPMGGMTSARVFLRNPSQHLCEFRKQPRKVPNN